MVSHWLATELLEELSVDELSLETLELASLLDEELSG
jgi:hypothetical protein